MTKKIEDYLHLYLGCECEIDCWVDSEDNMPGTKRGRKITELDVAVIGDYEWFNPKPILRPLSDMTIEELIKIEQIISPGQTFTDKQRNEAMENIKEDGIDAMNFDDNDPRLVFELFRYLLSKGFDLFGLIEAELAIDKTKMKQDESK